MHGNSKSSDVQRKKVRGQEPGGQGGGEGGALRKGGLGRPQKGQSRRSWGAGRFEPDKRQDGMEGGPGKARGWHGFHQHRAGGGRSGSHSAAVPGDPDLRLKPQPRGLPEAEGFRVRSEGTELPPSLTLRSCGASRPQVPGTACPQGVVRAGPAGRGALGGGGRGREHRFGRKDGWEARPWDAGSASGWP